MKRRTLLELPILLGTRRAWNFLANTLTPSRAAKGEVPPSAPEPKDRLTLENSNHKLQFDRKDARLVSFIAKSAPSQEFIVASGQLPAFVIQYLDGNHEFQQISSSQARGVSVQSSGKTLRAVFTGLGGFDLAATMTVSMGDDDPRSHWSISVRNQANLAITDVQFPYIVVSYHLGGMPKSEAILQPLGTGQLWEAPRPTDLEPDSPHAWQFRPENYDTHHYPGLTFAQFLAYYNDRAGILVSCRDNSGAIKLIKPAHNRAGGIRLGMAHAGDWPVNGEHNLGYEVVLQAFQGDWYEAAEIYRDWSLQQPWAAAPLHKRKDVPGWLLDSPPHIIVRIQGHVDQGPAEPNPQFLPYPKIMPLLEAISKRIDAPVVAVVMAWERPGPWIYPDCFPPAGGDASLHEFSELARGRGWHVGTYSNGTRWATHHYWTGYDGRKYYAEHHGKQTVCQTHDQQPWAENWALGWRPSFACCLGVDKTRELAENFVQRMTDDGLDWIQFLDQNTGCSTFPCFSPDHGHPPGPGKWMTAGMQRMLDGFQDIAAEQTRKSEGKRQFAFSVESPPNEFFMPNFQVCDQRIAPPGHPDFGRIFFPLYSFLYHEVVLLQGGFGIAPVPYHLEIRSAYNLVMGEILGGILTGDGDLLNRGADIHWWATWSPPAGNNDDCLAMLRAATALRRGKAKDFLVFGRMQRPAKVTGIKNVHWESDGEVHNIPAVFHSAWQSPEGKFAIVLANWTKQVQTVGISDARLGAHVTESISAQEVKTRKSPLRRGKISVELPPLSSVLIERA